MDGALQCDVIALGVKVRRDIDVGMLEVVGLTWKVHTKP